MIMAWTWPFGLCDNVVMYNTRFIIKVIFFPFFPHCFVLCRAVASVKQIIGTQFSFWIWTPACDYVYRLHYFTLCILMNRSMCGSDDILCIVYCTGPCVWTGSDDIVCIVYCTGPCVWTGSYNCEGMV